MPRSVRAAPRWRLLGLPLGLVLGPGCFEDLQHVADPVAGQLVPGALHVGILVPLSDGSGVSARDAALLAAADAGLVGGRRVVPVLVDSRPVVLVGEAGVEAEVSRRIRLLDRAGVAALVVSDDATAVIARRGGDASRQVVLSYAAGSDAPFDISRGVPSFRLAPPDEDVAAALVALALRWRSVAVITLDGDPQGGGLREAIHAGFLDRGGEVVRGTTLAPGTAGRRRDRLARMLGRRPGVVIPLMPAAPAAWVVGELVALDPSLRWVLPPTLVTPAFLDALPDLRRLDGVLAVAPAIGGGPAFPALRAGLLAATARAPGPFDPLAYDAVRLVAAAAAQVTEERVFGDVTGLPSGRDLARALTLVDYPGAYTHWRLRADGRPDAVLPLAVYRLDAEARAFFPAGRINTRPGG